jgi:hypothetical protein
MNDNKAIEWGPHNYEIRGPMTMQHVAQIKDQQIDKLHNIVCAKDRQIEHLEKQISNYERQLQVKENRERTDRLKVYAVYAWASLVLLFFISIWIGSYMVYNLNYYKVTALKDTGSHVIETADHVVHALDKYLNLGM